MNEAFIEIHLRNYISYICIYFMFTISTEIFNVNLFLSITKLIVLF